MNNREFLGTEPIRPLMLRLAMPVVVAQLVNVLYNVVDSIYIGNIPEIGRLALTGVGVSMPVLVAVAAFSSLIARGGAPLVSISMGEKNLERAERILGTCFSALIIIGIALTFALLASSETILMTFGASEDTIGYAKDYTDTYLIGTVFVMLSLGLNAFITAQGYTKIAMVTVAVGAVANIILDPIFIFLLNMGVKGAAVATVISQAISAVWATVFLFRKSALKIKPQYMKIDPVLLKKSVSLGSAPFVMAITESLVLVTFNRSLQIYGGDIAVGAMTVFLKLMQFMTMPMFGFTQGAQPILSYNFGAKKLDRLRESFFVMLKICLTYSVVMCTVIMLFPEQLVRIFNSDPELLAYSVRPMRIYFAGMVIFGIQIACQTTYLAVGYAKISLFLAFLRKVILLVPLIHILPMFFEDKATAVFLAEAVADIIAVTTTAIMFKFTFKKLMYGEDSKHLKQN